VLASNLASNIDISSRERSTRESRAEFGSGKRRGGNFPRRTSIARGQGGCDGSVRPWEREGEGEGERDGAPRVRQAPRSTASRRYVTRAARLAESHLDNKMQSRGDKTRVVCSRGRTRSSFSRLASCTPPSPSRACARDSYGRWEEKIARVRARAEISRRRRPATRRPLSSPARRATVDFRQSGRSPARAPLRHATMNDSCEALKASPLRSQVCSPPRRREATSTVLRSNASPIGMIVDRSLQLREHNSAWFRSGLSEWNSGGHRDRRDLEKPRG